MPPTPDYQTNAISSGLTTLITLLATPVAMSALELTKNAQANEQYLILKRLSKSLLQYTERDGALFYVGLIGHFSAGKTSSINSLLQTWKTEFERKTDFHPTDKTITLITKGKNADSLMGVIREGHVSIRLQKIESSMLEQIVLVDTPGTGDPDFFEEVARDFLPICDVILFMFSAASPLDASDVPLLQELHTRLPFIPLHFVVTRADELRLDANRPLTEANFDASKATAFVDSAVSRVNLLLKPTTYQSSSFMLIDNRSDFRLDQLRMFIANKCDASNPQAHVSMHMNKLQFYLDGAKALRKFFAGILDHKLAEVNNIVNFASRNIAKYQEIVQISNSNLTKTWFEAADAINKTSLRSNEMLRVPATLPADFIWLPPVNAKRIELNNEMERDAMQAAKSIGIAVKSLVVNSLRDRFYKLEKFLSETSLPKISVEEFSIESPLLRVDIRETDMMSSAVAVRRYNDLREAEANALRDAAGDLRRLIKDLEEAVNHRAQLTECTNIIEGARSSLKDDLNKFFYNVELYRTGVFSLATKEAISTLGIGRQLDQLEHEFTEEDKERFTAEATSRFFSDVEQLIANSSQASIQVSTKAGALAEAARGLRLERPETPTRNIQDALKLARESVANELTQGLQADIVRFCADINRKLSKAVIDAKTLFDNRVLNLRSEQRRSYLTACVFVGIVWLVGFLAFHHHERAAPKSAIGELVLGIGAGLILQIGTLLFVRWRKSLPKLLTQTQAEVHSKLKNDLHEELLKNLDLIALTSLNEAALIARLKQPYMNTLAVESATWRSAAMDFLGATRTVQASFVTVRQEQLVNIESLRMGALRYFTDSARNLSLLTDVAGKIKERAIEPSFQLLDTTREQLSKVKNSVTTVSFD